MALTFDGSVPSLTLKSTTCSMVCVEDMILAEKEEEEEELREWRLKERAGLRMRDCLAEGKGRENGLGKNVRALTQSDIPTKKMKRA